MTSIEQLAKDNGLNITIRGTQYTRLMLGNKTLTVFHGADWEPIARAWVNGWVQSQKERGLTRIDGRVQVGGQNIKYFWVVPATVASAFRVGKDQCAIEHIGGELKRGATRGLMGSLEDDGGDTVQVHGWWWSGDEEEALQEKENATREVEKAATRVYLDKLERVCMIVNDAYDAATAAGEKCFLTRNGTLMGRINARSVRRYHWITVYLSEGGRKRAIRLGPKFVNGCGAGKYILSISDGGKMQAHGSHPASYGCTEIVIPCYPRIAEDKGPY